ncbi:hypothetical protein MMC25_003027 [Agyrium rufum]|nr:hypothetical protein [Agyrium rufum]
MQFTKAAIFAAFAGLAAAGNLTPSCASQVGATPSGNAVSAPIKGDYITVGQKYTITWTPSSSHSVTLLFLQGPSSNVVPIGTIASSIPNSGSYTWQPWESLAPTTSAEGYGIEIVDDVDCTYQYSDQFGVHNTLGTSTTVITSTIVGTAAPLTTITASATVTVSSIADNSSTVSAGPTAVPVTYNSTSTYLPTGTVMLPSASFATASVSATAFKGAAGKAAVGGGSMFGALVALVVLVL